MKAYNFLYKIYAKPNLLQFFETKVLVLLWKSEQIFSPFVLYIEMFRRWKLSFSPRVDWGCFPFLRNWMNYLNILISTFCYVIFNCTFFCIFELAWNETNDMWHQYLHKIKQQVHSPSVLGCLLCHVTTSLLSTIFLVLLFSYTGYTLVSVFCFHHHLLLFDAYKKPITSFPLHEIHIAVWATYTRLYHV